MNIIYCKSCGRKLLKYDTPSRTIYRSPLKSCPKCGKEYLDPRCVELALSGKPPEISSWKPYIFAVIFGGLMLWRGIYLWNFMENEPVKRTIPVVFIIGGIALAGFALVRIYMILTGIESSRMTRLYEKSLERLKNPAYLEKLKNLGVDTSKFTEENK